MENNINITIDGREIETREGEFILNAARANDIFIPAICYLTRCSPTLACRICLVEADGKQVYACNAKAKDGMNITTTTENIETEKRAIMEVYDVNHPLECGVCDQSGECELQNYTLEIGVDSQSYAVPDTNRQAVDWGLIHYDPALCIVCERCTTVCKDMIGDAAIKTVPRGGEALNADYKAEMPKDAYAMWNKLNKSLIGTSDGSDMLDCTDCGECTAVCPVGALVPADFQYTSNAWEQKQIPATCAHCSAGCQISYDVKHTDIENSDEKIYRVKNEWNYVSLCGAGRYGFDFQNADVSKDENSFKSAIAAFEKADTISFTSSITNEEAYILRRLKEERGYKLINNEAKIFKTFLNDYSKISGQQLYGADLKTVHASDFVVSIGSALKTDNPNARFAFNNSMTMNKGAGLYFHPIADPVIDGMGKNVMSINHAPLQEEAALYLMLDLFADRENLPEDITKYLESFHSKKTVTIEETIKEAIIEKVMVKQVNKETGEEEEVEVEKKKMVPKKVSKEVEVDDNALLSLLGAPADFDEKLTKFLKKKEKFSLMVGADLYAHPNSRNLARLVALVEKYTAFNLVMIPMLANTLGVSLICDLDDEAGDYTIGYNTKGDYTLSALGDGSECDLDMPAINQQEGTLTSINKRVNPSNVAIAYGGYVLNDIANALGLDAQYTIDYTKELGNIRGFESESFDDLPNHYSNSGEEVRGYLLKRVGIRRSSDESVQEIEDRKLDNDIIYLANPVLQFTAFTNASHQLTSEGGLYASEAFMNKHELSEGDKVNVKTSLAELTVNMILDNKIDGEIAYLPTFDINLNSEALFDAYRFSSASFKKV
ncbi:MAG: NADH-quinone oxidoreductase subunit G [Campylobacterota bacterium]|nr:NADH-quinone oxidoreductase subunit G [Campylobacterota bacterium]